MGYESGGCLAASDSEVALHDLPTDMLVTALVNNAHEHRNMRVVIGRLAAELHARDPKHWTYERLAEHTRVPSSSLHRWAKPYLGGDAA